MPNISSGSQPIDSSTKLTKPTDKLLPVLPKDAQKVGAELSQVTAFSPAPPSADYVASDTDAITITSQRDLCDTIIDMALAETDKTKVAEMVQNFAHIKQSSNLDTAALEATMMLLIDINLSLQDIASQEIESEKPTFTTQTCTEFGLQRDPVTPDGNCLYQSLSGQLDMSVTDLREAVANKAESLDEAFFAEGSSKQDLMAIIKTDKAWTGDVGDISAQLALQYVADKEGQPVKIIDTLRHNVITIEPAETKEVSGKQITIIYNGFNHYDATKPIDGTSTAPDVTRSKEQLE